MIAELILAHANTLISQSEIEVGSGNWGPSGGNHFGCFLFKDVIGLYEFSVC